jgi:hypothetical protein
MGYLYFFLIQLKVMGEKPKEETIKIKINKENLKKVVRIVIGLVFLILGISSLLSLKEVSLEWIWFQFFVGIFFVLTGYGILRKKIISTYKTFVVFVFCCIIFISFLLFPLFKVFEDMTTKEKFVELSKIYWRVKVNEYFSTSPFELTQYGRMACYGVEVISGIPIPCDIINTGNIDRIVEYLALNYYPNSDFEKFHNQIQILVYPTLGIGILFSFFIFLLNKNNLKSSFKLIGIVLILLGILYLFFTPYFLVYEVKGLPQFKNFSEEDLKLVQNLVEQEVPLISNYGIVYLVIGSLFSLVGIFLPKTFLAKPK